MLLPAARVETVTPSIFFPSLDVMVPASGGAPSAEYTTCDEALIRSTRPIAPVPSAMVAGLDVARSNLGTPRMMSPLTYPPPIRMESPDAFSRGSDPARQDGDC